MDILNDNIGMDQRDVGVAKVPKTINIQKIQFTGNRFSFTAWNTKNGHFRMMFHTEFTDIRDIQNGITVDGLPITCGETSNARY